MATLIDTHTHLDAKDFDEDREAVIQRAVDAGVTKLITIGSSDNLDSARRAIKLAESYDFIWATAGVHPHDAELPLCTDELTELAKHPRVVAVGETGLDFYRDWSPRDKQYEWYRAQIEIAKEVKKPLIIHSRDAGVECFEVLKEYNASEVGGVFHCYAEDSSFAEKLVEINFIISIPGSVTFKNANSLRETVKEIPLERIMVETDAPYLAPHPYRGKRCESAHVVETAKMIAEVKELPFEKVAEITTATAIKFFNLG